MAPSSTRSGWFARVRAWFAWEPMRHAAWETFLFRAAIAWCAWLPVSGPNSKQTLSEPHGLAAWIDLTFCGDPQIMAWLSPIAALCLALYVCNIAAEFVLLPPLALSFAMGALLNSQGAINHATQITTVVLLSQWLAALWCAIQRRRGLPLHFGFNDGQFAADWARQAVMSTYVVSAISKLIESKGLWFRDSPFFGLQIVKSSGMARYGDTGPGNDVAWLAQYLIDHPLVSTVVLGAALPLELFAFLGVLNRRMALFFGLGLYLFHSTVTEVLHLGFVYHKTLLLALFINPLWWGCHFLKRSQRLR